MVLLLAEPAALRMVLPQLLLQLVPYLLLLLLLLDCCCQLQRMQST